MVAAPEGGRGRGRGQEVDGIQSHHDQTYFLYPCEGGRGGGVQGVRRGIRGLRPTTTSAGSKRVLSLCHGWEKQRAGGRGMGEAGGRGPKTNHDEGSQLVSDVPLP